MGWLSDSVAGAVRFSIRIALRVYFRSLEVEGVEHVPAEGPVLLLSNHLNAYVDPLVIQQGLRRIVTITAKGPLLDRPLYGALMRLGRVITFHRRQDLGSEADPERTLGDLAECRRRLAAGEAVCIFPEAKSHDDSKMRPFMHGATRVAVDFARLDGDPGSLKIVPVGLSYEAKEHFRSRVLVRYGEPIDVRAWLGANPGARHHALTREVEARIRRLIVEHPDAREALRTSFAVRLVAAAERAADGGEASYSSLVSLGARLREKATRRRADSPTEEEELRRRLRALRRRLRRLGVEPEDVFMDIDAASVARGVAREVALLLLAAPLAAAGFLQNLAPALVVWGVTRRLSTLRDLWAPNAVFAGLVAFPLLHALQAVAALALAPAPVAALYVATLPVTAWVALLTRDRLVRDVRRARAFLRHRGQPGLQRELAEEARAIVSAITGLRAETSMAERLA
jgi:1-acyl-sn-glycerol-3-phosphate acyltransferase